MTGLVANWFGEKFFDLHPLLQKLHREGGTLTGEVDLQYGSGLAGHIAPRLAKRLGMPSSPGVMDFNVVIEHTLDSLVWTRVFDQRHIMRSEFIPNGQYPDGYWREATGGIVLDLGVEIRNGGWY